MPPKDKRIHLNERANSMVRMSVDEQLWESGPWDVPEAQAKQLLGGSILFHKKKSEPSFFGGLVVNYRIEEDRAGRKRIIFTFQFLADHKKAATDNRGWSKDVKVVV